MTSTDSSATRMLLRSASAGARSNQRAELPLDIRTLLWGALELRFFLVYDLLPQERQAAIAELDGLMQADRIAHAVGAVFPLSDIVAAHQAVEAGDRVGNVVVRLRE
jgi:NADPH2:quinone reductase